MVQGRGRALEIRAALLRRHGVCWAVWETMPRENGSEGASGWGRGKGPHEHHAVPSEFSPCNSDRCSEGFLVPVRNLYFPKNDLTGEHSCVMLKTLAEESEAEQGAWLAAFWKGASGWKGDGGVMVGGRLPDL